MDAVKVELTTEEWGQVMMVLQSGVYRVVAPLLQKINGQLVLELQKQQAPPGPRLVDQQGQPTEAAQ